MSERQNGECADVAQYKLERAKDELETARMYYLYSSSIIDNMDLSIRLKKVLKNMKRIAKKELSVKYFLRIKGIFEKNKWEIECTDNKQASLFNRFCQRVLDIGENQQRDLFLDLAERYLWITEEQYLEYLIEVLSKLFINQTDIVSDTNIYVMPLIAPEDVGKIKSSLMLVYLFNNVKLRYNPILVKYKFKLEYDTSCISKKISDNNAILLLVDDFIGSGRTAEKCLESLNLSAELYSKVKIISLVAQQEGINHIAKYKIPVMAREVRNRGITDYYNGKELEKRVELMKQIECKMSVKNEFRFGYGNSEALVTMCRTPNNTFPVFWEENGNMKSAPFPRR